MVFQNYALYQHMTVYDNLAFGLRNRKIPEPKIKASIDRAAAILGLGDLMKRKPRQLSGGQQQRVALGRCIVRNPKAFLFDEPLSNLDAKLRTQMRSEIKRLRTQVPTTSVFVTHDQVEAMTMGDRVVVMRDGRIQQAGTPLEVYRSPTNKFVAGFIGAPAMNFADVTIRAEGNALYAEAAAFRLPVPPGKAAALGAWRDKPVVLGIRPEHLVLGGEPSIPAVVEVVEQLGSEIILEARVGSGGWTISRIDPGTVLSVGAAITLSTHSEQLHFFDPESETAIA
jgi:multiple sugar transport system ATP-binding protein